MGENIDYFKKMDDMYKQDTFVEDAKQLYRDSVGIGNPDAEYYKESMKTPEGREQYFMDFTDIEEDPRTKDYAKSAPAYEGFKKGGGVGSLNETARNMFRSYAPGGEVEENFDDIITVPSGESTVITQSPTEYSFGDVFKEAGEEAFGDASERLSSAFRLDPEEQGGSGELVRRVADGLEDVGIAALLGLKGGSEKILALAAEVIDKGASKMFETQGPEKLYEDMVGGSEVAGAGSLSGILGLLGRGSRVTSKVKNAGGMRVAEQELDDLSELQELVKGIRRGSDNLQGITKRVGREMSDLEAKRYKSELDPRGQFGRKDFAKGGMVGIGAYQNYMV